MAELSEQQMKDAELIRTSPLFDSDWYLATYRDVRALGMDPAEHYLKYGTLLCRDPGPGFSTDFYLETRTGVRASGINPLLHAIKSGAEKTGVAVAKRVMKAASVVADKGNHDLGIELAEKSLPENMKFSISILRANRAIAQGDEAGWLSNINKYLANFNRSDVTLNSGQGTVFSRLSGSNKKKITDGPVVSVIMPAWNASATIEVAVNSILNQTWKPVELIVIDDCSSDDTLAKLRAIEAQEPRLKVLSNSRNVGPYVSKNRGVKISTGSFITGHDADDWAHPERIETHVAYMLERKDYVKASYTRMIRMTPIGKITNIKHCSEERIDGVMQLASISCMFDASFFHSKLGSWDCVRFSADSELIARTEKILGDKLKRLDQLGMFCLDIETSLTNSPVFGISKTGGISGPRLKYRENFRAWHNSNIKSEDKFSAAFLDFPQKSYRFEVPSEAAINFDDISDVIAK